MKRTIPAIVSLLLGLLFTVGGCSNNEPAGIFITDTVLLIVPDGTDTIPLEENIKTAIVRYDAFFNSPTGNPDGLTDEEREKLGKRESKAREIGILLTDYFDEHEEFNPFGMYEPDWYGGDYIMEDKEYGIDAPYVKDGTDEPLKFCLAIVRGMESSVDELKELLKPYEEYIVYKTVDHSIKQLKAFLKDTMTPEFNEHGIDTTGRPYRPDLINNGVQYDVPDKYFNEETFALAKELANKHNMIIILSKCEETTFE